MIQDFGDNMAFNLWKVCPWTIRNRAWICVIVQAYLACNFAGFLLACVLNAFEGNEKWIHNEVKSGSWVRATGDTAIDECFWFVFTSMHGIAFGEFMPRGCPGRIIALTCNAVGYWFVIFMCSIVMLSQLPGEKTPTVYGALSRMINAVWPSYLVFVALILMIGSQCGPYVSSDYGYGRNDHWTGIYWMWQTAHRMPYGDLWPNTVFGRTVTVPAAIMGLLYMPYTLALVAVRCPGMAQHEALLGELQKHPEDSFGRGYVMPELPSPQRSGQTELSSLSSNSA